MCISVCAVEIRALAVRDDPDQRVRIEHGIAELTSNRYIRYKKAAAGLPYIFDNNGPGDKTRTYNRFITNEMR